MVELFYLFNCRSLTKSFFELGFFSNLWVFGGASIMLVLQLLFTYVPAMNLMFHSKPISLESWMYILAVATFTLFVVGMEKWFVRRRRGKV
jgi:Ca2+-transporting ATPase